MTRGLAQGNHDLRELGVRAAGARDKRSHGLGVRFATRILVFFGPPQGICARKQPLMAVPPGATGGDAPSVASEETMNEKMKHRVAQAFCILLLLVPFCSTRAAGQADYTPINVQNGGAIAGTVTWTGPVPKIPKLAITKNPEVCDPENVKTRDLERLLINPDGNGVANTVVFLRGITKGKAMDLPASRMQLDQRACRYVPHILIVPEAGTLKIESDDAVLHTVQMFGVATNNIPFPFQHQFIPVTLNRNGVIELKCNAGHVWMNANVIVVRNPYYAVTDEHGSFKLSDVPPGEYEIVAWHEGWQVQSEAKVLDVGAQVEVRRPVYSSPITWTKKVSVKPGEPTVVDFTLSEKHE